VTRRAAAILAELEQQRDATMPVAERNGHHPGANGPASVSTGQSITPGQRQALRRLATIEPLRMSPLDALSELMALVELATGDGPPAAPAPRETGA
jgi:hypothetical protein